MAAAAAAAAAAAGTFFNGGRAGACGKGCEEKGTLKASVKEVKGMHHHQHHHHHHDVWRASPWLPRTCSQGMLQREGGVWTVNGFWVVVFLGFGISGFAVWLFVFTWDGRRRAGCCMRPIRLRFALKFRLDACLSE
jgi:hypothetical protein